jgi:3-oxoacyl-[acyl-carrier protein] reductase
MTAAFVTGGAGIGRAVVQKLLASGSEVVSLDMKPSPEAHTKLRHEVVDLTDSHATRRVAEEIARARQATLPAMKAAGFGRVVLVSSRAVLGLPTRTAYATTKAGMLGMARSWALELAPHGITVNVVAPGPIKTDNFYSVVPRGSPLGRAHRSGEAARSGRRRRAGGSVFRRPGQRLRHRAGALRVRRHQRRQSCPVAAPPARAAPAG